MDARRTLLGAVALAAALLGPARLALAEDDEPKALAAVRAKASAAAARLAKNVLPPLEKLGPGWRAPWMLPATWRKALMVTGKSSKTYWAAYKSEAMFPAGLDAKTARAFMLHQVRRFHPEVKQVPAETRFAWQEMLAADLRPPAESVANAAKQQAIYNRINKAVKAKHENSHEWFEAKQAADKAWHEARTKELGGSTAVEKRLASLLVMPRARLSLELYHTPDWTTLGAASPFDALGKATSPVSMAILEVILLDESKASAVRDYGPTDLKRIQTEVQAVLTERYDFLRAKRPMMLSKGHTAPTIRLTAPEYGTGCHLIRVAGSTGLHFGFDGATRYTAWLRNGPALVRISLRSKQPDAVAEKTMTKLLELMDASTQVFALDD